MSRQLARGCFCACLAVAPACSEWLDPPPDAATLEPAPSELEGGPVELPHAAPRAGVGGPLLPRTPGLRVPNGYWARVRLDVADDFLPTAWASLHEEPGRVTLRLTATGGPEVAGEPGLPVLRAVIPLAVPAGADARALVGLSLGEEALRDATVGYRTGEKHQWTVTLERLTLDSAEPGLCTGTFEGRARRGSQGQRVLRLEAGFLAQRAP